MRVLIILFLFSISTFAKDKVWVAGSGKWIPDPTCALNTKYPEISATAKSYASQSVNYDKNDYKYCIEEHELGFSIFYQFSSGYYEGNLMSDAPGKHGIVITDKEGKFINYVLGA